MAIDLTDNVSGALLKQGSEAHQQVMTDIGQNGAAIHSIIRASVVTKFNEIGTLEGRANSGVNATPIAGPATAGE